MTSKLKVGQIVKSRMRLMVTPFLYGRSEKNFIEIPAGTQGEVVDIKTLKITRNWQKNMILVDFIGVGRGFTQFSLLEPCSASEKCDDCILRFKCFTRKDRW